MKGLVSFPDFRSQSVPKLGGTGMSTVQEWIWNRTADLDQGMADPGTPGAASVAGSSQVPSQGKQPMIYICGGKVLASR